MTMASTFLTVSIARLDFRAVMEILFLAVLIYFPLKWLRDSRATQLLATLALLAAAFYVARQARLELIDWLLTSLLPYFAIALVILFQPEIRRALARAGRIPLRHRLMSRNPAEAHDDVVLAVSHFAQQKIGALIVLERETPLKTYVESGIPLDAVCSYDLLVSVFHPGSPMHDGAAIIQANRVVAAACFLPLSLNPLLSTQLGTRHRAAIGVTEESDAVAVMVSEQTGAIALAVAGSIERNVSPDLLAGRLAEIFSRSSPAVSRHAGLAGAPHSEGSEE